MGSDVCHRLWSEESLGRDVLTLAQDEKQQRGWCLVTPLHTHRAGSPSRAQSTLDGVRVMGKADRLCAQAGTESSIAQRALEEAQVLTVLDEGVGA